MIFTFFISFVVLLRVIELIYSKHNEKWLLENGAIEYGRNHYPFIVILHVSFFIWLIVEYNLKPVSGFNIFLILLYIVLILFKAWVVLSLGKFWNTKIYRIPSFALIEKGPYKYFKHPNYFVVVLEIAIIPLAFHLYYTTLLFSILNALMIGIRINEENKVLINER